MSVSDRPSRFSQSGRILRVLEDGDWHSASEIFRNLPAGATLHSRVSELRKHWGFAIEHETRGPGAGGSYYRLVLPEADATFAKGDGETGGPSASASERTLWGAQVRRREPSPAPLGTSSDPDGAPGDILSSPSPREGSVPQAEPSQLALPLPARLREEAA